MDVDFSVLDDIPDLNPCPGSWTMAPADFAVGGTGTYRGYRAAGGNLMTPARTGAIYVAQNATYASCYFRPDYLDPDCRLWRVRLDLRRPWISHQPVRMVTDAVRASLPPDTDAIVMPRGDSNMGKGPVIAVLDAGCITVEAETWPRDQVVRAIQDGCPGDVPPDILADYPSILDRVADMERRWESETPPWRRF